MHTREHTTTHDAHGEARACAEGWRWLRPFRWWMTGHRACRWGRPGRLPQSDAALDLIARRVLETDYPRGRAYYLELYRAVMNR
jgi:hypothetical protein